MTQLLKSIYDILKKYKMYTNKLDNLIDKCIQQKIDLCVYINDDLETIIFWIFYYTSL